MHDQPNPDELVEFAVKLAIRAREETTGGSRLAEAENKSNAGDYDPVTKADRAAEQAMRELIVTTYPDHGISGEEFGETLGSSRWSWSLDPIDGTRSFICALPSWTTLVALLDAGRPTIGVIDAPILDETYVGSTRGAEIVRGGVRQSITTSGCRRMEEARFSTTDPYLLDLSDEQFEVVRNAVRVTRYGHDGYAYARLAAGTIDLIIEAGLKPHDYNAVIPIIAAAGGHVGDWRGGVDFRSGSLVAAASTELYDEAVSLLARL